MGSDLRQKGVRNLDAGNGDFRIHTGLEKKTNARQKRHMFIRPLLLPTVLTRRLGLGPFRQNGRA